MTIYSGIDTIIIIIIIIIVVSTQLRFNAKEWQRFGKRHALPIATAALSCFRCRREHWTIYRPALPSYDRLPCQLWNALTLGVDLTSATKLQSVFDNYIACSSPLDAELALTFTESLEHS